MLAHTSSSFVAVLTESMLCDNANDVIGTIWPIELSMVEETTGRMEPNKSKTATKANCEYLHRFKSIRMVFVMVAKYLPVVVVIA